VTPYREDLRVDQIVSELTEDEDMVMQVDCAGPSVNFVVVGWFVFPKRSLLSWRGDQPT